MRAKSSDGAASRTITLLQIIAPVCVVVSGIVIATTFTTLMARQTRQIGLLRCVGATRRQVVGSVLRAALLTGLAGSVAGAVVGAAIAVPVIRSGLIEEVESRHLTISWTSFALAVLVGTVVTMVSVLRPARQASRVSALVALTGQTAGHESLGRRRVAAAVVGAVVAALVCGSVGVHVVLRGMAFIGDAVAHSVFPGLAIAFVCGGSLVFGGALAGVVTAVLVALLAQNRRLKEDSVIGVLFVGAFALGVAIIARAPGYAGSLQDFLFGSITGIPASDVPVVLCGAALVLLMLFLAHRPIVAVTLDRESARAAGVHVLLADLSLYVAVALAVVISVQTIGNVLVLALLVTPAATARLLCDRLGTMMILSPVLGAAGGLVGLYLSWALDVPTGATIVLVLTACFVLAWVFAPRHGLLARSLRERRG